MIPAEISHLRPIRLLADRSRDALAGNILPRLLPEAVFKVTESRVRPGARLLRDYDVVAICGNGTVPYTPAERRAVRDFVRRGGTLLLASSAGEFERATGRAARDLATNGLARSLGFEFLSAAELPHHRFGPRALPAGSVRATPAGTKMGLPPRLTQLLFPAPLRVPEGATVLLEERKTGTPVAAQARVGRGTVVAWADLALWDDWGAIYASLLIGATAPARRRGGNSLPLVLDLPHRTTGRGRFRTVACEETSGEATRIRGVAERVFAEVSAACGQKELPSRVTLLLVPGSRVQPRPAPKGEVLLAVGAGISDAGLVPALTRAFVISLFSRLPRHQHAVLRTIDHALSIRLLEKYGHAEEAAELRSYGMGGRRMNLAHRYQETPVPRTLRRFLDDAERHFGEGTIDRFLAALPEKGAYDEFDPVLFTQFDVTAHYLARAVGRKAWDWLESRGHTPRRIPLGSRGNKGAVVRFARKLAADEDADLSERVDAFRFLARRAGEKPARLPRAAIGKEPVPGLAAALALALRRDERAECALGRWARRGRSGIRAIASLFRVRELRADSAADALADAAGGGDPRFRLMAGRALSLLGDPRAEKHDFEALSGSGFRFAGDRVHVRVDGRDVAVAGGTLVSYTRGAGCAQPHFYVWWVHTDPRWRGLGLARRAVRRLLTTPAARRAATHALHAEVDYVAYTLYREEGLFDYRREQRLAKRVEDGPRRPAPRGIRISAERPGEADEVCRFLSDLHRMRPEPLTRPYPLVPESVFVARERDRLVGAIRARSAGVESSILGFGVAVLEGDEGGKRRAGVATALLSALERAAAKGGAKAVVADTGGFSWDSTHWRFLARAGFGQSRGRLVEQVRVVDLRMYLSCLTGLFEARLAATPEVAGWRGKILLEGGRLRAGLTVSDGRVRVASRAPARPSITLSGSEEALTRVVLGSASSFTMWQKGDLVVRPGMGREARRLLDALFARVVEPTG